MDIHAKWIKEKQGRNEALWGFSNANGVGEDYDLVVAVDCIYNEALIPPFLSTLEYYTTKGKTIALIVCELRSADVVSAHRSCSHGNRCSLLPIIVDDSLFGRVDRSWRLDYLSFERYGTWR